VVDAVGKPNAFQIGLEILPVFGILIPAVILVNIFQRASYGEVVLVILVIGNVTTRVTCLTEVINVFFFF